MNDNEKLEKILKMNQDRIKSIDTKNGLFLSINALSITAVSFLSNNIISKKWIIIIITLLVMSIIFFILAIVPVFWNRNEKNRKNPLHIPHIYKNRKNDLSFLTNEISKMDYKIQIQRVNQILIWKYIFQWIGIIILFISFIFLILGIIV